MSLLNIYSIFEAVSSKAPSPQHVPSYLNEISLGCAATARLYYSSVYSSLRSTSGLNRHFHCPHSQIQAQKGILSPFDLMSIFTSMYTVHT